MNKNAIAGFAALLLGSALTTAATAQVFLTDANGQVMNEKKYVDIQGSPYLNEAWKEGSVTTVRNRTYTNLQVRYDAYAGELEYQQNKQNYRLNSKDIKDFTIQDENLLVFRNGFTAINTNTPMTFYQVLYDGSTKLLKQRKVNLNETKPYNSPNTIREFSHQELFYISRADGSIQRVQKNRKSVLSALGDQKERAEKIIREKGLDIGDENGLVALLSEVDVKQ